MSLKLRIKVVAFFLGHPVYALLSLHVLWSQVYINKLCKLSALTVNVCVTFYILRMHEDVLLLGPQVLSLQAGLHQYVS